MISVYVQYKATYIYICNTLPHAKLLTGQQCTSNHNRAFLVALRPTMLLYRLQHITKMVAMNVTCNSSNI